MNPRWGSVAEATQTTEGKRTAAGRLLALLDAFLRGGGALRLTDISRYADLPLPTTHRLVREVMEWGGLECGEDGRYRLSRKFLDLASVSTSAFDLREQALPQLIHLQRRTGLAVQLSERDRCDNVYLEALRPHPNWSGRARIGGRLPLHATAAGLLLLAHADPEEISAYLSAPLKRFTEKTVVDPAEVKQILAQARRDQYLVVQNFISMEAGGVAAPVVSDRGEVIAAVGVVFVTERDHPGSLVDLVRLTANRISRDIAIRSGAPDPRTVDFRRRDAGLL